MRITLLQTDIEWGEVDKNLANAQRLIGEAPGSDLYVLPEMFATGWDVSPVGVAEVAEKGRVFQWMRSMAKQTGAAVAGSVAVRVEERGVSEGVAEGVPPYRNRFYFVTPEGEAHYDKRHLFAYGDEHLGYGRGEERVTTEWRGVRFLLQTCYDLRFPMWSRNGLGGDGRALYDVVLYTASWPSSRMVAWETLLRARAIENQCYAVGVNRVGRDPRCSYSGGSMVVDAYGEATPLGCDEDSLTMELDLPRLYAFRHKFPVLADRDEG